MADYSIYEAGEFKKLFGKLDGSVQTQINKALAKLSENPFHNSKTLNHPFLGKRSFRAGKYRIIFVICEECRMRKWQEYNQCAKCLDRTDNSVVLFTVGLRKNVYDR